MDLCSTDMTFTQHKHDTHSLISKLKVKSRRRCFERHLKLQADPRRIRGARDSSITKYDDFYWLKKMVSIKTTYDLNRGTGPTHSVSNLAF